MKKPLKSHEKLTSKSVTSNEKSSETRCNLELRFQAQNSCWSGPFLGNNSFPLKVGFCQWAEMGPRVGFWLQTWFKSGSKPSFFFHPLKTHFGIFAKTHFLASNQFKGGGNCFLARALRQSWPSITQNPLILREVWRFGAVNNKITSGCDGVVLVR